MSLGGTSHERRGAGSFIRLIEFHSFMDTSSFLCLSLHFCFPAGLLRMVCEDSIILKHRRPYFIFLAEHPRFLSPGRSTLYFYVAVVPAGSWSCDPSMARTSISDKAVFFLSSFVPGTPASLPFSPGHPDHDIPPRFPLRRSPLLSLCRPPLLALCAHPSYKFRGGGGSVELLRFDSARNKTNKKTQK